MDPRVPAAKRNSDSDQMISGFAGVTADPRHRNRKLAPPMLPASYEDIDRRLQSHENRVPFPECNSVT